VTDVFEGERRFAAVVRLPERFRDNIEAIRNMLVTTPDGAQLPLSSLARIDGARRSGADHRAKPASAAS
jgi:cobalt-zinc-cadmium resistance protein CzcA